MITFVKSTFLVRNSSDEILREILRMFIKGSLHTHTIAKDIQNDKQIINM